LLPGQGKHVLGLEPERLAYRAGGSDRIPGVQDSSRPAPADLLACQLGPDQEAHQLGIVALGKEPVRLPVAAGGLDRRGACLEVAAAAGDQLAGLGALAHLVLLVSRGLSRWQDQWIMGAGCPGM